MLRASRNRFIFTNCAHSQFAGLLRTFCAKNAQQRIEHALQRQRARPADAFNRELSASHLDFYYKYVKTARYCWRIQSQLRKLFKPSWAKCISSLSGEFANSIQLIEGTPLFS